MSTGLVSGQVSWQTIREMPVYTHQDFIYVKHTGEGNAASAEPLVRALRKAVNDGRATYPRLVVLHDTRQLLSANEAYARPIGELGKELGPQGIDYIGLIPDILHRVLGRMAGVVGGVNIDFVKKEADAFERLRRSGVDPDVLSAGMTEVIPPA